MKPRFTFNWAAFWFGGFACVCISNHGFAGVGQILGMLIISLLIMCLTSRDHIPTNRPPGAP